MAYVGAVISMRVESIQLETCHSVYFLRVKVSIWGNGESARTSCDFPNMVVTVGVITASTVPARTSADVLFVVAATDHRIHEAVNENVINYGGALCVVVVPIS